MNAGQRGFTLLETTLGAAIAFFVLWMLTVLAARSVAWAGRLNAVLSAQSAAMRFTERISSEGQSAWAVFVPPLDVQQRANADGHEIDFFTEDAAHRPSAWAYEYDALTKYVTRYSYAPGAPAQAGERIGPFDEFRASAADVTMLASPGSAFYDALFAGASAPAVHVAFASLPNAQGGNAVVALTLRAQGMTWRTIAASATAPTTFTLVFTYTPPPAAATPTPGPLPTLTPTPP